MADNEKTTICPDCISYEEKDGKKLCIGAEERLAHGVYNVLDLALKVYAHWYRGGVNDRKEIIEYSKRLQDWSKELEKAMLIYDENKCLEAKDPCHYCEHFKKQESTPEADAENSRKLTDELLRDAAK